MGLRASGETHYERLDSYRSRISVFRGVECGDRRCEYRRLRPGLAPHQGTGGLQTGIFPASPTQQGLIVRLFGDFHAPEALKVLLPPAFHRSILAHPVS